MSVVSNKKHHEFLLTPAAVKCLSKCKAVTNKKRRLGNG